MTVHPRRRFVRLRLAPALWLAGAWMLLWSDLSLGTALAGFAIGLLVTALLPMPPVDIGGRIHVLQMLVLLGRLAADITVASVQVARQALTPGHTPHGAVIRAQLRSHSDLYLTLTAELCSLVPGSIVVEAHRVTGVLYLHLLDVRAAGGIEAARASVLDTEARVMRALASDEELAEAGLSRTARADRHEVRA